MRPNALLAKLSGRLKTQFQTAFFVTNLLTDYIRLRKVCNSFHKLVKPIYLITGCI